MQLQDEYIRSADNVIADRLSRAEDRDDWRLNPRLFQHYDATYHDGRGHDVDQPVFLFSEWSGMCAMCVRG